MVIGWWATGSYGLQGGGLPVPMGYQVEGYRVDGNRVEGYRFLWATGGGLPGSLLNYYMVIWL